MGDIMQEKSKFEKIFTSATISLAFVVVGLLVLGIMQVMPMNRFFLDLLLILAILCFGCVSSLSAVKMLSINKKNIYAYIILGLTGFVCLLWIIFIFVGRGLIDALASNTADMSSLANAWGYTKTVIFLTVQASLVNLVLTNIYNLKKSYLVFQIIMYVCNFLVDLWISILVLSLVVTSNGIAYTANWLLDSSFIATLFVLCCVFSWLSAVILRNINRRRIREAAFEALASAKALEAQNKDGKTQEQPVASDENNAQDAVEHTEEKENNDTTSEQ